MPVFCSRHTAKLMKSFHYSCEEVEFQTSEKDIHYLYPRQTVWMTLSQGTYVVICFQEEQGLKLIQLQWPQWGCSSLPTSRILSNVFKRMKEVLNQKYFYLSMKKYKTEY